ncbi:hypothetical protein ABIE50_005103 [Chitinophaga sp. OAE865]
MLRKEGISTLLKTTALLSFPVCLKDLTLLEKGYHQISVNVQLLFITGVVKNSFFSFCVAPVQRI